MASAVRRNPIRSSTHTLMCPGTIRLGRGLRFAPHASPCAIHHETRDVSTPCGEGGGGGDAVSCGFHDHGDSANTVGLRGPHQRAVRRRESCYHDRSMPLPTHARPLAPPHSRSRPRGRVRQAIPARRRTADRDHRHEREHDHNYGVRSPHRRRSKSPWESRVRFMNSDSRPHNMASDPHPEHTDCPEFDQVGFPQPGTGAGDGKSRDRAHVRFPRS
jgi:hypothetical protein